MMMVMVMMMTNMMVVMMMTNIMVVLLMIGEDAYLGKW